MYIFALLFLLLVVYLDCRALKKKDLRLFEEVFFLPLGLFLLLAFIFVAVFFFTEHKEESVSAIVLVFLLPFYLSRRYKFYRQTRMNLEQGSPEAILSGAYLAIMLFFLLETLFMVGLEVFFAPLFRYESRLEEIVVSSTFSTALSIFLVFRASRAFSSRGFLYNVALKGNNQSFIKTFLVPLAMSVVFGTISAYITIARRVQPETPLSEILEKATSIPAFIAFFAMAIIIAPLAEEIIFRGYFFEVIRRIKGERLAIYVVSITFGLLHFGQYRGDWPAILMVMAVGFTLSIIRSWSKSTLASVVGHYSYNLGVTVIPVILVFMINFPYFEYKMLGDKIPVDRKIMLLRSNIAKEPHFAEAYNELALIYAKDGQDLYGALELADKALSLEPEMLGYLDTKAMVLFKLKRFEEALKVRNRLRELNPQYQMDDYISD
ncbi:MAG: CPBP family intramembrane metalloprotease [Candidatus Omnitrophica bacterium]|nr:CPBP family intramembrane metalloprotease [Candidatus Omnitrophota bacterium]